MKIILVSRCSWTLYNFRAGLMRHLKRLGYAVIGGGAAGDGFGRKFKTMGIPFVSLPVDKKPIRPISDIRLFWSLYRWYSKERPDIVHHFTIKPVIYGSIAAYLARVPRIINTVTGLGYAFTDGNSTFLRLFVQAMYRIALGCSSVTFFLNKDDLNYFLDKRLVQPDKAFVLNSEGVDCAHFSPDESSSYKARGFKTFLILCRLLKEKGIYEFVDAARRVKDVYPETQFLILGERDERNPSVVERADLERWGSEGVVRWQDKVSDVRPVIADADVVVLPSYYREGTPRALLEGAAMGKALITTDSVGCRETVQDGVNGLLVPPKDSEALAQAMIQMIETPNLIVRMGRAGREMVELEFDEKIIIKQIIEAYSGTMGYN